MFLKVGHNLKENVRTEEVCLFISVCCIMCKIKHTKTRNVLQSIVFNPRFMLFCHIMELEIFVEVYYLTYIKWRFGIVQVLIMGSVNAYQLVHPLTFYEHM